nr:immunoglobulin heavy chain junction region [Macaca mulatta]MOW78627.1 immunoglobulin heavy chain junction region [Macaca mulatta]MOW83456.1 immunoglobulin heavy chain junction region [Macaca mulatta]
CARVGEDTEKVNEGYMDYW